jgi:predicted  nucleic acid-binding Zn ribbon protein
MLRDGLSDNPLFCVECGGEVPPERVGFDAKFAEEIANWLSTYDSLYRLWLDSGEYEEWATSRLLDPSGQVNTRGREIVSRLNSIVPAYYWWFVDTDAGEDALLNTCPVCSCELATFESKPFRVCAACRILS